MSIGSGLVDGRLNSSQQGVTCTVYRDTTATRTGGFDESVWAESIASLQIAVAEISDQDKYRLSGRETDADFRGVVSAGVDVVKGDGIEISASALHHAGMKFIVLAARDPEGTYRRLFLEEKPEIDFTP